MSCHWLTGPNRTNFFRCVVANCEDEVELRSIRRSELIPGLRPEMTCVVVGHAQNFEREGVQTCRQADCPR